MKKINAHDALIDLLNQTLAQTIDLKLQAKQAHWNVKDVNFISFHELFDMLAKELDEYADLLAERVVQLGGTALGTLQVVAKASDLKGYPVDIQAGKKHIEALLSGTEQLVKKIHQITVDANIVDDDVTADIGTGINRSLSKMVWFLSAHLY